MSIVDDRGRVGGRINLIDLLAVVALLVVVPVAYGAYLLFRTPPPTLLAVEPTVVSRGPNMKITIRGENLRPFMRVSFNTIQGRSFLIGSTESARVDLPELDAGTYDVVLYDYMQEVARLPQALTILSGAPVPTVTMQVAGSFKQITDAIANELKVGTKLPLTGETIAEVVSAGTPRPATLRLRAGDTTLGLPLEGHLEMPAMLKVKCYTESDPDGSLRCLVPGPQSAANVARDSILTLAGPGGWLNFQIDEVHLTMPPTTVVARVRFVVTPQVLAKVRPGDTDAASGSPSHAAVLTALHDARPMSAAEAGPQAPIGGPWRALDTTVRVPIEWGADGWLYQDRSFKAGAPFTFETHAYVIHGEVIDVELPPAAGVQESRR